MPESETPRHNLSVTETNWDLTLTYTEGNPISITNGLVNAAIEDNPSATRTSLELGTAALSDSTDFATAAQGALADTAVQPEDFATPPPIGNGTPNTGAFTTLSATGTATLPHIHGNIAGSLYIHVRNTSGVQLTQGTPVYITGNVGNTDRVEVAAADNTNPAKMPAVGLLSQTLAQNGDGDAVIVGELPSANTNGYSIHQELFVGVGAITGTKPTTGEVQSLGIVSRVNTNTGVIVVNMQGRRTPDSAFATAAQGALADTAVQPADLAEVATSGDYNDLSNLPTLGTAAAADTTDFATAAQGTLADSSLQPTAVDYRGEYDNGDGTYGIGAVVLYNELLYQKISNPNNAGYPPSGADWELFEPLIGSPAYDLWVQTLLASKVDNQDLADYLPLAGGTMDAGADIVFANGSMLREGTTDAGNGGAGGIAQVCSISYELKWEAGRLYVMEQDGFTIRAELFGFSYIPNASDDSLKGYVVGSRRILDDGTVYICTDATTGSAVWVDGSYVPYTGANANVDLGSNSLLAASLSSVGESNYIDLINHSLNDSGTKRVDWANSQLNSGDGTTNIPSVDWDNRQLIASDGSTVATDWSTGIPNFPNGITSDGEVTGTNIKNHTISDTAPVSPSAGDTWLYSATGQLFEYYTDVDGSQWIEITGTLGINDYVALSGDQTIAGNKTFSGQTELTGQTAASGTSAMTRALSDARYGRIFGASLTAGVNSDVNTTTYKTVTELSFALDVGNYYIDAILIHNGNASYATSGVKDRLDFTGTATSSGTLYRVLDNATTSTSVPNSLSSRVPTIESAPTNRSQTTWRKGVLTVTAAGTLRVQIAQTAAVVGANTTLDIGSQLIIHRIP